MDTTTNPLTDTLVALTAQIVTAHVAHNTLKPDEIPGVIQKVHATLSGLGSEPEKLTPAVPVKKSITNEFIVCLEDGKKLKTLKRYLRTHYELTPDQYRARWNLPHDYPMVAPKYAAQRSAMAKANGLGKKPAKRNGSRSAA
jgi:predicted transcriptional regulator